MKAGKTAKEPTIGYLSTNTYHLPVTEKGLEGNVHEKIENERCPVEDHIVFCVSSSLLNSAFFAPIELKTNKPICDPTTDAMKILPADFRGSSPLAKENDDMYNTYGI